MPGIRTRSTRNSWRPTGHRPPPQWNDPCFFGSAISRSWRFPGLTPLPIANGSAHLTAPPFSAAHRSGMGARRSRRPRAKTISLGRRAARIACELRDALEDGARAGRAQRAQHITAFSTSARMCTNGARTGSTRTITPPRPTAIRKVPPPGTRRASRGGSWRHYTKVSRCSARSSIPPEFQYADYGFRVACDAAR